MNFPIFFRSALLSFLILPTLFADTPAERADKYFRGQTQGFVPGMTVLVARDGQKLFEAGYGFADIEKKTLITPETKFRIGSITKQFTAAAILKLAEQGKLKISDPVAKYFPETPNSLTITLRHLLTHTSGLHSYTERPDFYVGVSQPIVPSVLIASLQADAPDFAPGARFEYCNTNYYLLGEIVAKVSGQSLADYLRTTFFGPLGMKDTGIYLNATPPPDMARGYAVADGRITLATDWDMSWAGGAGALYSTVDDLWRWTEALHGGRVLNADSLKAMTTPNPLPPGTDGLNYGFGLVISDVEHLPAIWHNGGLDGWSANLIWLPKQKVTVVALANAMPAAPGLEPGAITDELTKHFLADDIAKLPRPVEDKTIDPKTYAAYVGRYDYQSAILTVSVADNHLYAQLTGQEKYEIFPEAKDEFFWKITEATVRFLRNEKGEVVAVQHSQGGNTFHAPRLGPDSVKLTAAQLDAYVGQYKYSQQAVLTVTRDDQQLFAQLSGQPSFPIFPTTEDTFEWRWVKASVHFVRDADGKVDKALHTQDNRTLTAPKIK